MDRLIQSARPLFSFSLEGSPSLDFKRFFLAHHSLVLPSSFSTPTTMSGLLASSQLCLFSPKPKPLPRFLFSLRSPSASLPFCLSFGRRYPRLASFSSPSAVPGEGRRPRRRIPINDSSGEEDPSLEPRGISDEWGEKAAPEPEPPSEADPPKDEDEWGREPKKAGAAARIVDEWGEEAEPEPVQLSDADTPRDEDEDEWGKEPGPEGKGYASGNDSPAPSDKLGDLKRCLVDTLYGTNFGLRASAEVRAETLELVSQLEAENPTRAPTETPEFLEGNWILL